MTDPKTKREAEEMIQNQEQHGRLCERAGRKAAGFPALAAEKFRAASAARTEAARLRALMPTLKD